MRRSPLRIGKQRAVASTERRRENGCPSFIHRQRRRLTVRTLGLLPPLARSLQAIRCCSTASHSQLARSLSSRPSLPRKFPRFGRDLRPPTRLETSHRHSQHHSQHAACLDLTGLHHLTSHQLWDGRQPAPLRRRKHLLRLPLRLLAALLEADTTSMIATTIGDKKTRAEITMRMKRSIQQRAAEEAEESVTKELMSMKIGSGSSGKTNGKPHPKAQARASLEAASLILLHHLRQSQSLDLLEGGKAARVRKL
mmetsp:Transcript_55984/g.88711  ORF Transcript_55984/g.88711 Transcript_55984/m.88711 type:complete len:253 (-) Transcript_55984:457-1215(-)